MEHMINAGVNDNMLMSLGSILRLAASGYPLQTSPYGSPPASPGPPGLQAPSHIEASAGSPVQTAMNPHWIYGQQRQTLFLAPRSVTGTSQASTDEQSGNGNTLHLHLTDLQNEDPERVFITRRIGKMGFESQRMLEAHFSWYGKVRRVMVSNSKVKSMHTGKNDSRIRPGSLGFIVMEDPKSVQLILNEGSRHVVAGCEIRVERFQQRPAGLSELGEQSEDTRDHGSSNVRGSSPSSSNENHPAEVVDERRSIYPSSDELSMRSIYPSSDELRCHELANALSRLVRIMEQSENNMPSITGAEFSEAAALTRLLQHDINGLVERFSATNEERQSKATEAQSAISWGHSAASSNAFLRLNSVVRSAPNFVESPAATPPGFGLHPEADAASNPFAGELAKILRSMGEQVPAFPVSTGQSHANQ
ncbi:unnamed protein product, partial [Polarella glacialis]